LSFEPEVEPLFHDDSAGLSDRAAKTMDRVVGDQQLITG